MKLRFSDLLASPTAITAAIGFLYLAAEGDPHSTLEVGRSTLDVQLFLGEFTLLFPL